MAIYRKKSVETLFFLEEMSDEDLIHFSCGRSIDLD